PAARHRKEPLPIAADPAGGATSSAAGSSTAGRSAFLASMSSGADCVDSCSCSVLLVAGSPSCTGVGPNRASRTLITERAHPRRSQIACWVHPCPAHARARATWRSLGLVGRPRRRPTSPAEPCLRALPRRIDTYVAVNPNTAATSSTRRPASVNATIARLRIPGLRPRSGRPASVPKSPEPAHHWRAGAEPPVPACPPAPSDPQIQPTISYRFYDSVRQRKSPGHRAFRSLLKEV